MSIKRYFPISVAFLVLVILAARHFSVPVAPFAAVLLVGETLLGFELEDHRVPRFLGTLLSAFKPHATRT